jgi:putative endonuclease
MYYVYVLYSGKFDRIYIGQTNDISARIWKHNNGLVKSTKAYVPWHVVYSESFVTRSEAMRREKELKSHQGRDFIRKQIRNRQSPAVAGLTTRL